MFSYCVWLNSVYNKSIETINKRREKMEKLDLGNNESLVSGITKNNDGTFTALTFTQSKTFKTLNGAKKWLLKRS